MRRILGALGVLFVALPMAACATATFQTGPMRQTIVEDVGAFNDAYAQSASNLILWNVLRARDRLPRNYVAIQTITSTRSRSVENRFDLESLDLGGNFAADPWGVGTLGATTTSGSQPGFGVAPVVAERINQAVLDPIPSDIFVRYWQTWGPEDVLMAVMVDRMTHLRVAPEMLSRLTCLSRDVNDFPQADRGALADVLVHDASERGTTPLRAYFRAGAMGERKNQIDEPITSRSPSRDGDEFLRLARLIKEHPGRVRVRQIELGACGDAQRIRITGGRNAISPDEASRLLGAMTTARANNWSAVLSDDGAIEFAPPASVTAIVLEITANSSETDPFGNADGVWEFELRSLDQAIYYLGETIRQPEQDREFEVWNRSRDPDLETIAPPSAAPEIYGRDSMVTADCSRDSGEANAPLFRVRRVQPRLVGRPEPPTDDGVSWQFDDITPAARVRYRGAIYESGPPSPLNSSCHAETDFSGQVLTLLTQLLAANLSQESTESPARISP